MKPLLVLIRIIIVGLLWSIFFMESTRVIMLRNWHFDILNREHWKIAWDLWSTTWVISEPKEWAFVLIVVSFIPLWFTGWITLSLISWGKFTLFVITLPWKIIRNIFSRPTKIITTPVEITPVTKRPSYKEIRPKAVKPLQPYAPQPAVDQQSFTASPVTPQPSPVISQPTATPTPAKSTAFEHPLFSFDNTEEADIDFDIDSFDVTPQKHKSPERRAPEPEDYDEPARPTYSQNKNRQDNRRRNDDNEERYSRNNRSDDNSYSKNKQRNDRNNGRDYNKNDREQNRPVNQRSGDTCSDIIKEKGFELINRVTIKNTIIDHVAVSATHIFLCMLDREPGDWLADEERFNDEEPLWFSENSHRISPVRKLEIAKQIIENRLSDAELSYNVETILIEQMGNIINAEDMVEIWESMNIKVCRIDRGMPKELPVFARTLPEADKAISANKFERLVNIIRNIG